MLAPKDRRPELKKLAIIYDFKILMENCLQYDAIYIWVFIIAEKRFQSNDVSIMFQEVQIKALESISGYPLNRFDTVCYGIYLLVIPQLGGLVKNKVHSVKYNKQK